ncbi:MAG: ABC transporter ATP-binding protein [Devosia sp.]|uniref:ABC transporter ATP-binding protein n=1 Tax=Devosia sp. TaxID=1871048 RepID=UPI001AC4BEE9|nr:ABC transporter ATP-binding protein [Devosia sp.]MBN9317372.1 ABC transporter ATP-binding protein [Devosia sp.]
MSPLLEVEDLHVDFTTEERVVHAVRGVSFTIAPGQTVALVGESGSGKSVTALSVLRLLAYPPASHPNGSIRFKGEDLLGASEEAIRKVRGNGISMIFQEPMSSLNPLHTVERQVSEALIVHRGMSRTAAKARTIELLTEVGIQNPQSRLDDFPHQLSGGQRQRVMIAMALANEPDLLIADEPTTALDVTVQAQVLDLLQSLQKKRGLAILFITHHLGIVRKMAETVHVMTEGKIVESGPTETIFTAAQHAYTRKLLAAEPRGEPLPAVAAAEPVMVAEHLRVWFPIRRGLFRRTVGHIKAVDDVDLTIRRGETLGVVGESGSGKTTLGRAVLRLVRSEGRIAYLGQPIDGLPAGRIRPLRKNLQMVFQDPYGSLSPRMSVADIVAEGLGVHEPALTPAERDARVVQALREVGLEPADRHRYPHEFSGGQRQRVAIARAMVLEPKFVVLDEPTSALDVSVQAQVVDLLRELQRRHGLTYMFISHDLRVVRALANHVLVMRDGKVVEHGTARDIFAAPQSDYTRALLAAAFTTDLTPPAGTLSSPE